MTNNTELKELKRKLKECETHLNQIEQGVKDLKSRNRQEIKTKEQELEEWRNRLEILQQAENKIKKEIREKVVELEQSNLSNTEKQEKINKLLTEHSQELEELDNLLYDERSQYRNIRDNLIRKLVEDCQICSEKERLVVSLEKQVKGLRVLVGIGILTTFLCFGLFLYSLCKRERERERESGTDADAGKRYLKYKLNLGSE